ncbi:MAG: hypothetical protein F4107_08640 [Gemmatimonadetes bacterium]|nr:hypothetical protein [Gemmatimonadota bacterium]MYD13957.1 hypothetical protein [Gemmatimonadota bacterium]MYI65984.1 hypothetical protein [Gemmatimonadota bacterium]
MNDRILKWWRAHVGPPELLERWGVERQAGPVAFPKPGDDVVTVRLRGPIVSAGVQRWFEEDGDEAVSGASFAQEIAPAAEGNKPVLVLIDSPGGSVTEAARIRTEMIRARQNGVPTIDALVEGASWSAATVVMALCDEIAIEQLATVMIHQPRMLAYGTAATLRDFASSLDEITKASVRAYSRRIGEQKAAELLGKDRDIWLSASSAVDLGLCDVIFEAEDDAGDPPDPPDPDDGDDDSPPDPPPDPDAEPGTLSNDNHHRGMRPDTVVPALTIGIGS